MARVRITSYLLDYMLTTSLSIIGRCGLNKIHAALKACETLRTPLCRSDKKRVFTDLGKTPKYACVGPQVSRNKPGGA